MSASDRMPLGPQLARFVAVGGASAVVDFGLLLLGQSVFGWDHTLAKAVSWVFGTATAYALNRRWTFVAEPSGRRLVAVVILYALTFALQVGTFAVLFEPLRRWWGPMPANVVGFVLAQGLATAVNFVVQRGLIFKPR